MSGAAAGMQVLLRLPDRTDDGAVATAASERGIGVSALSRCTWTRGNGPGPLLAFGRLPEHKIDAAVRALREATRAAG